MNNLTNAKDVEAHNLKLPTEKSLVIQSKKLFQMSTKKSF